jgi:rhamnogalacturonyl hydrolase YesR
MTDYLRGSGWTRYFSRILRAGLIMGTVAAFSHAAYAGEVAAEALSPENEVLPSSTNTVSASLTNEVPVAETNAVSRLPVTAEMLPKADEVLAVICRANDYWQDSHRDPGWAFWDNAAYHTGNMAAYFVTGKEEYLDYSMNWAKLNNWMGATSDKKSEWKYSYGDRDQTHVLFGDWQICFQTYIDLYNISNKKAYIKRALEVMEYEMSTDRNDYWWWADGLYMVMPVMTKLYKVTGDGQYLDKLYEYFNYSKSIMYDEETGLFYRDARFVYPQNATVNGLKDFWARGDGWVFAGLSKVLADLPKDYEHYDFFRNIYLRMAETLAGCQQADGYWTRSLLDPEHAPGCETSGTAFYTYGFLWGINNGILDRETYLPVAFQGWKYLTETALQENGRVGYVQPIGDRAIPGQVVDGNSTENFGVGAFLLAASEMYRMVEAGNPSGPVRAGAAGMKKK